MFIADKNHTMKRFHQSLPITHPCIFFTDRPGMSDHTEANVVQVKFAESLKVELKQNHPEQPKMLLHAFAFMTELRSVIEDYVHFCWRKLNDNDGRQIGNHQMHVIMS